MRSKKWKVFPGNTLVAKAVMFAALVSLALPAVAEAATSDSDAVQLIGAWTVEVTQVDCTSGAPLGPSFTSMITCARGGTMIEDTLNPAFGHGQRGNGQGTWKNTGTATYSARTVSLIKYTTPANAKTHNPGFNAGGQTIAQDITFSSGHWSSTATVTFTDLTGNVYRQGCAVATGNPY